MRKSGQSLETKGAAADISNRKHDSAGCDEEGKQNTESREKGISNFLSMHAGYADDPPYIYLYDEREEAGNQDDSTEATF